MITALKDQVLGRERRQPGHGAANHGDLEAALPYPTVSRHFWRPKDCSGNFGDQPSRFVVELMLARQGRTLDDEARRPAKMPAIGSVMPFAKDGATVWGSGVNGKIAPERHTLHSLDLPAVRGPYAREFLGKRGIAVPEVYGDSALVEA